MTAPSPFGTSFNFGANPAFGTPSQPASTPGLFGGAAPAFGAASGGFGFGAASTPAFGTPGTATPAGANATPGAFGYGAAGAPAFGAASGGGLFGAAPAASSAASPFGSFAPAASSASAFGAASAPATTSFAFNTGGGLFGGSAAASSGSSMFGGFGQSSGGSMFGAAPAGGLFGGAGQSQLATSTFGTPSAAQSAPQQAGDAAVKEVLEIKAAYNPADPAFKFKYLLLNVVDNPAQRVKPPGVDEMRWRQAMAAAGGPDNPDRLWPVLACGFKDLLARSQAQAAAVQENNDRLKQLTELAAKLARKHQTELKQRATDIQQRHVQLSDKLLRVCRTVDALESRLAVQTGYRGDEARLREARLSHMLGAVEAEVSPASATSLLRRLDAIMSAARMRSGASAYGATGSAAQAQLDERSSAQLQTVLRDHAAAVGKLQAVLKRDLLDVQIMKKEMEASGRLMNGNANGPRPMLT